MRQFLNCFLLFIFLYASSCQGELLPYGSEEPLILEPTPYFDSQKLNQLCEINYFEESLFITSSYSGGLQNNPIYQAMEEWNTAQSNIHFSFQKELNKCNLIFKSYNFTALSTSPDAFDLIRIDGNIQNPQNTTSTSKITLVTKNSSYILISNGLISKFNSNSNQAKRELMYKVGRYLGLPDSKDRSSYMYPYLVIDGTEGKITDEDIINLKKLHPTECGKGTISINSTVVNSDGTANFSVKYSNQNSKIKPMGCGIIVSEDSTDLTLEKNPFYIFNNPNADNTIFSGKVERLNASTKYYARAFSVDVNGINFSEKINSFNTLNQEHDKWIPINLPRAIETNSFHPFIYNGKIYYGISYKQYEESFLNFFDLNTKQIGSETFLNKTVGYYSEVSFYLNGYLYQYFYSDPGRSDKFVRISLENLKTDILSTPLRSSYLTKSPPTIFSDGESVYMTNGNIENKKNYFFKYTPQNDTWNLLSYTPTNFNSDYTHNRIIPTKKDNQLFFIFNEKENATVFDTDKNTWSKYDKSFSNIETLLPQNLLSISSFWYSRIYPNTTISFQNKIIKLLCDTPGGNYIQNGNNSILLNNYYPNIFSALESNVYNFDRQALLSFDINNNSCKLLKPLPRQISRNFSNSSAILSGFSIFADDKNIYAWYGTYGDNFPSTDVKTIWKYIP